MRGNLLSLRTIAIDKLLLTALKEFMLAWLSLVGEYNFQFDLASKA